MIQTDYTFASSAAMLAGEGLLHERWPGQSDRPRWRL